MTAERPIPILMAEDDLDDQLLVKEAFEESKINNPLYIVNDGQELLAFLRREAPYEDPADAPRPGLILLDLNMPRLDGREALTIIKTDPSLRSIPVVVLTTSQAERDVFLTYDLGVSSFIVKPVTFDAMINVVRTFRQYWFEIVELPASSMHE